MMVGHDDAAGTWRRSGPNRRAAARGRDDAAARAARRAQIPADESAVFPADGTYGQF